jgi:hypothetical protein
MHLYSDEIQFVICVSPVIVGNVVCQHGADKNKCDDGSFGMRKLTNGNFLLGMQQMLDLPAVATPSTECGRVSSRNGIGRPQ